VTEETEASLRSAQARAEEKIEKEERETEHLRARIEKLRREVEQADVAAWMVEKDGTLSKKSRLGEAFSYVLNQWDALCYYSDDGLAEADNNTAERALRAVCLGKKNSTCSSVAITVASVVHCCTG